MHYILNQLTVTPPPQKKLHAKALFFPVFPIINPILMVCSGNAIPFILGSMKQTHLYHINL